MAACLAWSCATTPRQDTADIALTAASINAGATGRAILVALGQRTQVTIVVSGVPPELVSRPVHLYTSLTGGTCAIRSSRPSYVLVDRVLAQPASSAGAVGGALTLTNVAPVPLETLRSSYAVRVATSPADGDREIFCGEIQ